MVTILCFAVLLSGCQRMASRFIGVQTIEPQALGEMLAGQPAPIIIDLRSAVEFNTGHLPGAIRLTVSGVAGYMARSGFSLQQVAIVICESGWDSQIAAAAIAAAGFIHTYSLNGGFAGLKNGGFRFESGPGPSVPSALVSSPVVSISTLSQLVMTIAAFAIKPIYMLLSALIVALLWRQRTRELRLLRLGMLSFLIGEGACALNYLTAENAGLWLEFFHGAGMVGSYAFVFGAVFVFLDEQIFHYSAQEQRCAMQRFCRNCWKNQEVDCGLFRIGLLALVMLAVCALVPITMPIRPFSIIIPVFDSDVLWLKDFWNLFIEYRVYPILGAICALVCFLVLYRDKEHIKQAQPLLFLAVGLTGYAFFRFGLLLTFKENQAWANWWEELSELMLVGFIWGMLVVYHKTYDLRIPAPVIRFTHRILFFRSSV